MTISSTNGKTVIALAFADQTVFPYNFKVLDEDDISVSIYDNITGTSTSVFNTEYEVSGVGNDAGGNITFYTTPVPSVLEGRYLVILRDVPLTQETDYVEYDAFPAQSHEAALDKLTMIAQQIDNKADQGIRLNDAISGFDPVIKGATPAGGALVINATEDGFEFKNVQDSGAYLFPTGTGILAQTADGVATNVTIEGDSNITVTNGDGVSGNPTIELSLTPTVTTLTSDAVVANTLITTPEIDTTLIKSDTLTTNSTDTNLVLSGNGTGIVDVQDNLKASGIIDVAGTASAAAQLRLFEQTTNGTNKISFVAPASLTADRTITLPDADVTLGNAGLKAITAYMNANQNVGAGEVKLNINSVYSGGTNGTTSDFSTVNYRFTPTNTGAGLYLIHLDLSVNAATAPGTLTIRIYKNATSILGTITFPQFTTNAGIFKGSTFVVDTLSATDYIEVFGQVNNANNWAVQGASYPGQNVTKITFIKIA